MGILVGVGMMVACQSRQAVPGLFEFQCAGGKKFYVDYGASYRPGKVPEKAVIHYEDQAIAIPQAPDGKGIRYSDGLTTFRAQGDAAELVTRVGVYERCQVVR